MKRFLINVFLFGFGYLVLNILAYQFLMKPVLYNTPYLELDNSRGMNKLLLSDSHGAALFKDDLKPLGIINGSTGSDSYYDMYYKLKYAISQQKIDTVILTADDHTLSKYRERSNNLERSLGLSSFADYKDFLPMPHWRFLYVKSVGNYLPLTNVNNSELLYRYLVAELKGIGKPKKLLGAERKTYGYSKLTEQQKKQRSISRMKDQFIDKETSASLKACLTEIIALCKENNIALIGLKFPLTGTYINTIQDNNYGADAFLKENNVPVIDTKTVFQTDDTLFKDQDHLSPVGSEMFCKLLAQKLKSGLQ